MSAVKIRAALKLRGDVPLLARLSGVPTPTIYGIADGRCTDPRGSTLAKLLAGLKRLPKARRERDAKRHAARVRRANAILRGSKRNAA